jgi:GTPase SAR1 family protein
MLWDTSSDDDYRDMTNCHLASAQACVFVYAVDDQSSFDAIFKVWSRALDNNSRLPHITFIVGNKIELPEAERIVRIDAAEKTLPVFVSCADGTGVQQLLETIATALVEAFPKKVNDGEPGTAKAAEGEIPPKAVRGGCGCELL